jgi:hypothetical protein
MAAFGRPSSLEARTNNCKAKCGGISTTLLKGKTVSRFGRDDAAFVVGGEEQTTTKADSSALLRNDKPKKGNDKQKSGSVKAGNDTTNKKRELQVMSKLTPWANGRSVP